VPDIPNILGPLVGPLTELLMLLTGVLHSYGLAIIIFTILVRAVLAPLNLRQLRSAKKMSALAPKIKEIQQKYKGDREALTKAQMALYKEEGVNPASGCLPLLIQMPILYALFFVFRDLADLKLHPEPIYHHAFLWFTLDKPDNLFGHFFLGADSFWGPLPLLAGLTQWVQSRMMMQPTSDPQQRMTQQIMQVVPLMIIVFAVNYPSGLALYWVTSTLFSIVLQYFITGWGQLFKSPFHVPEAPPPPPGPRRTTAATARENGREREARVAPSRSAPRRDEPSVADGDEQAGAGGRDSARLGKMQRAAMRSKTRPRSSRGVKR
jgi:YidC/Oxa1 family membrane protein insertase